ncbi:MAG: hypothetical protein WKF92_09845 [Pyrinomonadaceae bacterium]
MLEEIEKLKLEKEKLQNEHVLHQGGYKSKMRRINTAIRNFEQGVPAAVDGSTPIRRRGAAIEIEKILREHKKPMHLKLIVAALHERLFVNSYQSISGLLQVFAKKEKKFTKVGPSTYALITAKTSVKAKAKGKATGPFAEKAAGEVVPAGGQ